MREGLPAFDLDLSSPKRRGSNENIAKGNVQATGSRKMVCCLEMIKIGPPFLGNGTKLAVPISPCLQRQVLQVEEKAVTFL